MNADEFNLVKKYRSLGLLVDTNLLMLLWVGRWNSAFISRHKRTNQFDANDYGLLEMLVELFTKVVVTPCILAEASNLVRQSGGKNSGAGSLSEKLVEQFRLLDERHIESIVVADSAAFIPLGLTDAGIALVAREKYLVVTSDLDLYCHLQTEAIDAINFHHLRH